MKYETRPDTLFGTPADQLAYALFTPVLRWFPIALILVVANATIEWSGLRKLTEQIIGEQLALFAGLSLACVQFFATGFLLLADRTHDGYPGFWVRWLVVGPGKLAFTMNAAITAFIYAGAVYLAAIGSFADAVRFALAGIILFLMGLLIWLVARFGYEHAAERAGMQMGARFFFGVTLVGGSGTLFTLILAEVLRF
jgi:hypothetical protein